MNVIRPISSAFRPKARQLSDQPVKTKSDVNANLPVVIPQVRKPDPVKLAFGNSPAFAAQLLAGSPRRGIRASQTEQARYFAAYRPLVQSELVRQQKWA